MNKKIGLLIVGINGAIGTTVTSGLKAINENYIEPIGLLTAMPEFAKYPLVSLENLIVGGWDIVKQKHIDCIKKHNIIPKDISDKIVSEGIDITVYDAPISGITGQFEGILRESTKTNKGIWCDTPMYSIIKSDLIP